MEKTDPHLTPEDSGLSVQISSREQTITIELAVGKNHHGFRLDRFLGQVIRRLSRARIQQIIREGHVTLKQEPERTLTAHTRLRSPQVLLVRRPLLEEPEVPQTFSIIHHDHDLLIIDKPAGLPVHPSARYHNNTLTALLRQRLGHDHGFELAHRLDRETSGVLLLARKGPALATLKRQFAEMKTAKSYLAIVHGHMPHAQAISAPLGPALNSQIRIKIGPRTRDQGGLPASTHFQPLRYGWFAQSPITLVEATPRHGRQHQIRVHAHCLGHGILGDKLYGVEEAKFIAAIDNPESLADLSRELGLPRQALHAHTLTFTHPFTQERKLYAAPWPAELACVIELP